MHERTGSDLSKVTTHEINTISVFMTGKKHKNALSILKTFQSVRITGNYYEANSTDAWKYYLENHKTFLERRKINSWDQLIAEAIQNGMNYDNN